MKKRVVNKQLNKKNPTQSLPENNNEDIDKIIETIQTWKNGKVLNGYYSPIADSLGYIPGPSAKEILESLGLETGEKN